MASAAAAIGLVACGDDDGDENPTTAGADATEATAAAGGEAVLIKTRVTIPTGEVLSGSSIGDSPFCGGGKFSDKGGNGDIGSVDRTFVCPEGSLRIGFTPGKEKGLTQTGPWKVISGTGDFEGLQADGQMEATFETGSGANGRETFTGTAQGGG